MSKTVMSTVMSNNVIWNRADTQIFRKNMLQKKRRFSTACAALMATALLVLATPVVAIPVDDIAAAEAWRNGLYRKIAKSVVLIANKGHGTGFFVAPNLILTNAHVVGESKTVTIVTFGGHKLKARVIEKAKEGYDLALISVEDSKGLLTKAGGPVPLMLSTAPVHVGDQAATIGHGTGLAQSSLTTLWSLNTGIVTNVYPSGKGSEVFETQIPVNPGNSGGPIFNKRGEVVGVATAGFKLASSINFAIKITVAKAHLHKLGAAPTR